MFSKPDNSYFSLELCAEYATRLLFIEYCLLLKSREDLFLKVAHVIGLKQAYLRSCNLYFFG